jgi:hypothetical protein
MGLRRTGCTMQSLAYMPLRHREPLLLATEHNQMSVWDVRMGERGGLVKRVMVRMDQCRILSPIGGMNELENWLFVASLSRHARKTNRRGIHSHSAIVWQVYKSRCPSLCLQPCAGSLASIRILADNVAC